MQTDKFEKLINQHRAEFDVYYQELVSYNEKVNLTAITQEQDVFVKHFLDSILAADEIKQNASVVDVGTGAGFPSVPLKIVRPDINITLVDSLNKRVEFLNLLLAKLNISSTNIHARAEEFAVKKTQQLKSKHSKPDFAFREKFDVAVARAVARLNTLLEYLLPLVKVGGKVLAYKSSSANEEILEAQNAINLLGGKLEKVISYELPNNAGMRNIVVITKIKSTPVNYPRQGNQPKKNPL